ncbi:MAG: hypothetical protein ACXVJT_02955 [Thermoanaerobaculia bacterium]
MTDRTKTVRDNERGPGATEDNVEKIKEIHGSEVLGYKGEGREEHSGQTATNDLTDPRADLADNDAKKTGKI